MNGNLVITDVVDGRAVVYVEFNLTDEQLDKLSGQGARVANNCFTLPTPSGETLTAQVNATAGILHGIFDSINVYYEAPNEEEFQIEKDGTMWRCQGKDTIRYNGPDDVTGEY